MAISMGLVNLCLIWLFLQDIFILTYAHITVYTTEGSTANLPLKSIAALLSLRKDGKSFIFYDMPFGGKIIRRYGITISPDILEFQIKSVTANDTGFYSIGYLEVSLTSRLTINDTSCRSSQIKPVCAMAGSSPILTFRYQWPVYKSKMEVNSFNMRFIRRSGRIGNVTIQTNIQIYNVTHEDEGVYRCVLKIHGSNTKLQIVNTPTVVVRYTNRTIECDCDGVPPIYSVYRLDRISKYGELVRSVNLDNGTFIFKTDQFPYQRNGRYMCVVSNGIPDTNGNELQNSSIHVNYEDPPVFAKENRYVNHGKVGQSSIRMSFLVYSCPGVEEIFLQKLGRMRGKKIKLHKYVLKSTLLYNELDNGTGVPGYYILIKSDELDIKDVQAYIITIKNRLGASDYHFEIIKKEDREIDHREKKYLFTICIVTAVLFGSIIIHIGFCVNRTRPRVPMHSNMNEDRTYHTYDEIETISHGSVSNVRLSETHGNQGQNLMQQHAATFSNIANVQITDNDSNALNADLPNDNLQQRGVIGVHEQCIMSLSKDQTNIIDDREQSNDQKSQTSSESDSESSQTVMAGNVGDGYENPYQTVLLDRPESHQYTQITIERHTSNSSAESNCEMQILEKSLTKEGGYINLQF